MTIRAFISKFVARIVFVLVISFVILSLAAATVWAFRIFYRALTM